MSRREDRREERAKNRQAKISEYNGVTQIIFDVVLLVLGIVLIVWPVDAALMLTRIVGIVMLVFAVIEIVVFVMSKSKESLEVIVLIGSIILAGIGIWLIVNPDWLVQFFNILFGLIICIYGIFGIVSSIGYARHSGGLWWIGLIMSVIGVALAILIFMNPFATPKMLMIIIGVTLIVAAVTGVYNTLRIRQAKKVISVMSSTDFKNIRSVGSDDKSDTPEEQ
ncbi:Uncharacterized membrane protein HdeD, DUF308 family [Ruminococcaceae bacterium YRB3002]|nr:Uncharacterized membrane protein HdeD, DUF308 family [Ruminococcaceae bacterium YRB3002]